MKPNLQNTLTVLVCAVATAIQAAEPGSLQATPEASEKVQRRAAGYSERLAAPSKASDLIGKSVVNLEGKSLGKVDDLAIDLETGRVTLVVISSGGFLGLGSKDFAVPPGAFQFDPGSKSLRLDVDKEKFKAAPPFEKSKWDEQVKADRMREVYIHYGQEPYFDRTSDSGLTARPSTGAPAVDDPATRLDGTRVNRPDPDLARKSDVITESRRFDKSRNLTNQMGWLNKASAVIGMPVLNVDNQRAGQVDNLILDLETGRIVHVIVSSGGVLGIGDTLHVVPPGAVHYNAARDAIMINLTKEQLAVAPNFKSSEWPNFGDPAYSGKVYRAYGVDPYFTTDADNTSRNVRDRQPDRLSPLDQGKTESDLATTRLIRQRINERDGLSVNARNVKIITVNGRVTLRGPVNSEEEKAWISELAKKQAPNGEVDDQIEVKRDPKNN